MNLPKDIILDILSRLPVRSLIRFKCVSKTWYVIIESPSFIDMHLTFQGDEYIQTLRNVCFIPHPLVRSRHVVTRFDNLESLSCLTQPDIEPGGYQDEVYSGVQFSTHTNGLVCIFSYHPTKITLWNPSLREFRILPPSPFLHCPGFSCGYQVEVGFGFDDAINDYKVVLVKLFVKGELRIEVVQVYSLKSNSWRRLETMRDELLVPLLPYETPCCSSIFFKGIIHWLVWGMEPHQLFILTFNITTGLFHEIQCPFDTTELFCELDESYDQEDWEEALMSRIFILDNSILPLVVVFTPPEYQHQMDVWVMTDYNVNDSWTKRYSITIGLDILRPLSFWKKDQLLVVGTHDHDALILYDLRTGQPHHIRRYARGEYHTLKVVVCAETLISVKG